MGQGNIQAARKRLEANQNELHRRLISSEPGVGYEEIGLHHNFCSFKFERKNKLKFFEFEIDHFEGPRLYNKDLELEIWMIYDVK